MYSPASAVQSPQGASRISLLTPASASLSSLILLLVVVLHLVCWREKQGPFSSSSFLPLLCRIAGFQGFVEAVPAQRHGITQRAVAHREPLWEVVASVISIFLQQTLQQNVLSSPCSYE